MTTVIQPHPVYKNYGSAKDGSVYNYKGRKITVGTRHKRISVFDENGKHISILHRLFVWQCFNGELGIGLKVIFDDEINGDFCDKLIAVNNTEKEEFNIKNIKRIRQQMITAGYFAHPLCPNYLSNKFGQVYSLYANKEIGKNPSAHGYIQLMLLNGVGKKVFKFKHVLIWESNTNTLIPTGYDIDHIDQNKENNAFANLQCISRKDHIIKTQQENPHIIKAFLAGSNRKVIRTSDCNDSVIEFASRKEAAESVFGSACAVGDAIRKHIPYMGFMWSDTKDPDLPGEEWLQGNITKYRVSNLGRIWPKNGYKTFGFKCKTRYTTKLSRREYGVHELICYAFHGPKPSPGYTVDHIDRNPHNNHYLNLRYATKQEQARNRRSVKPVEGYIRKTNEIIGTWPTITEAAAAFGANIDSIRLVLKGSLKNSGKTSLGEPIAWRYKSE